ncbi:MAG TPA: acyl-CoA dehydrogenase family protein, partial [Polyangiaceae bacterium]|nr:acyl-CoA dehydrogenase family protein [Polyangiaceae bacterium]
MQFELNETEQLIQKTAREFATQKLAPVAAEQERDGRFPLEALKGLAELGLLGVNVDAEFGGAEAGVLAYSLAMMEVSRACASTGVSMAVTNMVAEVIQHFGNDDQKREHLPKITSGEHVTGAF